MISEAVYLHYLGALLQGDKRQCLKIVETLLEQQVCLKDIYLNLFQRSMYRIGKMWENNNCSIAAEHMASKITESLVDITIANIYCKERLDNYAVITCVDKEFHEIGARMVAGFFETHGWNTIFLGSNTPPEELIDILKKQRPDILGISINFYMNIPRLINLLERIKAVVPNQKIIIGGQALAGGVCDCIKKYENVEYLSSLDELEKYILELQL